MSVIKSPVSTQACKQKSSQTHLPGPRLRMLLLNLHLHHITRMQNHLTDKRLMPPPNLPRNPLPQIAKTPIHPILPKNPNPITERRKIRLNHTKRPMNRPKHKKNHKQMMRIPKPFKIRPPIFLRRGPSHGHQSDQHDVACPAGAGEQIGADEALETEAIYGGEFGEVVPVGDGVDPGEEDDGPADEFVEGDVFVEGNDAVEGCAAEHRDEVAADGEEDEGDVDVEDEGGGASDGEGEAEGCAGVD